MIGIAITTVPSRDEIYKKAIVEHFRFKPDVDFKFYIHDDKEGEGVAYSKNQCLKHLEGCDDIFLFDDDCYPIAPNWWKPYVESGEPHLMYQFKLPGKPKSDMREVYRDEKVVAYTHTRGAMIYIKRTVLDVVGGLDIAYGVGGFEHPDWTNRIHNAGLTTYRAMDVPGSDKLFYCLDQDGAIKSSLQVDKMANYPLYRKSRNSKKYKEFRL